MANATKLQSNICKSAECHPPNNQYSEADVKKGSAFFQILQK